MKTFFDYSLKMLYTGVCFILLLIILPLEVSAQDQFAIEAHELVKKEIKVMLDSSLAQDRDIELYLRFNKNNYTENFQFIKNDGSMLEFNGMEYEVGTFFKQLKEISFENYSLEWQLITNDKVLVSWIGKYEFTGKKGVKWRISDYVLTLLFIKDDERWLISYAQVSASRALKIN